MVTINGVVGGVQADARHASTGIPEPSVRQAPKGEANDAPVSDDMRVFA